MLLWLAGVALAGTVYVNDVDVSGLTDTVMENVTVTFDSKGDVRIAAPHYEIQVMDPPAGAAPAPAPTTAAATAATGAAAAAAKPAPPTNNGVAEGTWWLVTEDNGSAGHEAQVWINGQLATTITSGGEQLIEDVSPWLRPGSNKVRISSVSSGATGGALYIYIGAGSNDDGTLMMDTPSVQFGLGASREGEYERDYEIVAKGG